MPYACWRGPLPSCRYPLHCCMLSCTCCVRCSLDDSCGWQAKMHEQELGSQRQLVDLRHQLRSAQRQAAFQAVMLQVPKSDCSFLVQHQP